MFFGYDKFSLCDCKSLYWDAPAIPEIHDD